MIELPAESLRGCFTPLVTPFRDGEVDHEVFRQSVLRQIDGGAPGVVVTGTSGEPTSLSSAERLSLYRDAVEVADGRIEVVAATGSANQADTFELTEAAEEAGVDAVLVLVPAFVKPSQEGLARHFEAVAKRTSLPLMIYNIPGRAASGVTPETVVRVARECPNLVGVKHASTALDPITQMLAEIGEDFRIFCGLESLSYPMLALGGAGLMNAVGNLVPARLVALCEAVAGDEHAKALGIHRELFEVNRAIFFDTNPVPLKRMLSHLGLGSEEVRPPLAPLDDATRERVDAVARGLVTATQSA